MYTQKSCNFEKKLRKQGLRNPHRVEIFNLGARRNPPNNTQSAENNKQDIQNIIKTTILTYKINKKLLNC